MNIPFPPSYTQVPDCRYSISFEGKESDSLVTLPTWIAFNDAIQGMEEFIVNTADVGVNMNHTDCAGTTVSCQEIIRKIYYIATLDDGPATKS